jgi:hypothetical protein
MTPVRMQGMRWARLAALVVALAVFAGSARAQPPTMPSDPPVLDPLPLDGRDGKTPGDQPRRGDPKAQPGVMHATPTANVQVITKPPAQTTRAWVLEEATTVFLIIMISLAGIAAMAVATHFYFRLTAAVDPYHLARSDPWLRAHMNDPPPDPSAAEPAQSEAPTSTET